MSLNTKYIFTVIFCLSLTTPYLAFSKTNETIEPSFDDPKTINLLESGTLNAWKVPSNHWHIDKQSIIGDTGKNKIETPEWLQTKQRFGDFVFTCELKLSGDKRRNTGIYVRANTIIFKQKNIKNPFEALTGYELDAHHHQAGKRNYRGSLGDWYARPSLRILADPNIINKAYITDEWNRMTIRARGNRLEYWINGIKVMDFSDPDPKGSREGVIGLQIHDGSVMKVEYRNIHVRSL